MKQPSIELQVKLKWRFNVIFRLIYIINLVSGRSSQKILDWFNKELKTNHEKYIYMKVSGK